MVENDPDNVNGILIIILRMEKDLNSKICEVPDGNLNYDNV